MPAGNILEDFALLIMAQKLTVRLDAVLKMAQVIGEIPRCVAWKVPHVKSEQED